MKLDLVMKEQRTEGKLEDAREKLLTLLQLHQDTVTPERKKQIESENNLKILDLWFNQELTRLRAELAANRPDKEMLQHMVMCRQSEIYRKCHFRVFHAKNRCIWLYARPALCIR